MKRTKMTDEQRKARARYRYKVKHGYKNVDFPHTDERLSASLLDFDDPRIPKAVIQYPIVERLVPPDGRWKRKPVKSGDKCEWLCYLSDSPDLKQPSLEELLRRDDELKRKHEEEELQRIVNDWLDSETEDQPETALTPAQVAARIMGSRGGQSKSAKKAAAARLNGCQPKNKESL